MNKIQIFYHLYCVNDCYERFISTYNKIVLSGLIERVEQINAVLVGPNSGLIQSKLKNHSKVIVFEKHNSNTEAETLNMVWDYCKNNNGYVLYLHSKGVTRPTNANMSDWKNLMEYFLIEKYESCLEALKNNDVCGVNFLSGTTKPHFSGNFWWATTEHIKKLKNIKPDINDRLYCEFWVLDTDKKVKHKEMHNSNINHYKDRYPIEKYAIE
jgi:hypothetical protein